MDKTDLVIKHIESLKEDTVKQLDNLQEGVTHIKDEVAEMGYDVRRNADDLVTHMKRTALNEKRLERLENKLTVSHLLKLIVTVAAGLGTISGAIYGSIRLIEYLS